MAGKNSGQWWRCAAIYQVYIRSFVDGNGDGIGDLDGVRGQLPYLAELARGKEKPQHPSL